MRIWLHPGARAEMLEARRWYRERSEVAVFAFSKLIEETLLHIVEGPDRFPARVAPYREAVLQRFPFTIVFRVREGRIEVYRLRAPVSSAELLAR